ncbi:MAG: CHASE2 domain-containing protein [Halioglobus sp.]
MHSAIGFLQRIFLFGRGRPVAIIILLWMTMLCVLSELRPDPSIEEVSGSITRPFSTARQFLFDSYQKYHPREPLSQPVTIVAVDETSLARLGQWPWPRNKLAEVIDAIDFYQPAAIGFDMYMPEADQTSPDKVAENLPPGTSPELLARLKALPSHEERLAQSLASVPSILGAAGFDFTTFTSRAGLLTAPVSVSGGDALPYLRRFEAVLASLPVLQSAARGQAILSVDLEFGVVRRIPLVVAIGDEVVSGLAMEMLRIATGSTAVEVEVARHGIESVNVADLRVPTQPGGEIWLHYARSEATAGRYVSAVDVLEGRVDPEQLSGKLVMLGLTGSGLHDMRTTALRELVPGIEIQAQVLESMFDGRFLLRPWWIKWLEVFLIVAIGSFLIWFIPRTDSPLATFLKAVPRASMWLTLGLNVMFVTLGYLLFRQIGILFDASSFFIILSSVMGSLVSSAMIEFDREAQHLALRQQETRETANLVAGKLVKSIEAPADKARADKQAQVKRITRLVAEELATQQKFADQLNADSIDCIVQVAPLHDAGMASLAIDGLLLEELTQAQREAIGQHAEVVDIAIATAQKTLGSGVDGGTDSAQQYLHCFREIVESQYEWVNGGGYPQGLTGDEIPLAARIIAVVDCYLALVDPEPERAPLDQLHAVEAIEGASGTRFDPGIVAGLRTIVRADS